MKLVVCIKMALLSKSVEEFFFYRLLFFLLFFQLIGTLDCLDIPCPLYGSLKLYNLDLT